MSSIINITGEISGLADTLKQILEKHLKTNEIIINDSQKSRQLTIPISKDIIDIYHGIHNSVLYVYLFQATKKLNANHSSICKINKTDIPVLINYRDAASYNIMLASKGIASISKGVKKNKLELVSRINDNLTVYKFAGKYLFAVDSNGFLYYYPDSIDIQPLETWTHDKIKDELPLDKYLLLNKFIQLECYLEDVAYSLEDVTKSLVSQECKDKNVVLLDENNHHHHNLTNHLPISKLESNLKQNEHSTLGYLLSWLNPLSYYSSNATTTTTNIDSNTITSNTITSNTATSNTVTSNSINTSNVSVDKSDKINTNLDTNAYGKRDASYYLDTSTTAFDIVKISRQSKTIKTLKSHKIDIPAFITDIAVNNLDEVILEGRIESQTLTLKFNKYLINMQL